MVKKHALITGLNGFTGKYVAAELESAGYVVYGTGTGTGTGAGAGAGASDLPRYYQVDLLDKAGLIDVIAEVQPSVVVHLAAIAFVGHGNADSFYQVNVIGTRNLLEALDTTANGLEAVLLASSANVYGNATEGELAEYMLPNPANDYAVSKLAMEYMAKLWQHKLPLFIVRPFNYTGIGQSEDFLIAKIVAHFRRQAPLIELGNLDVWRDFSDVRTVAHAYRRLLEVKPLGKIINVCSGNTYSLREVITMAKSITGHDIEISVNPNFVRPNEVKHLSGNPTQLHHLIGNANAVPLVDTLHWMLTE